MVSTLGMTSLVCAFAFFLIFKERLLLKHLLGMVLMILSITLISLGKNSQISIPDMPQEDTLSVFVPISIAITLSLVFTSTSIVSRASKLRGFNQV
jgi:hypothetical protein